MKISSTFSKLAAFVLCGFAVLLGSCSQTPVTVTLHSLQASGNVSFVCRGADRSPSGHKLDACPDIEHATRRLLGLVTQTATNEVAIVDLYAGSVVDVDQSTPGYSFLRVGARPGAIVTTPGGAASFVGVTGVGKNGVFALPTTCLSPPDPGQSARDLTSWPACHLSSAPGDIQVVIDPPRIPGVKDSVRPSCSSDKNEREQPPTVQASRECPADLTRESGPVGRRKLFVALPEEHRIAVLDAQRLLDRNPGEFADCEEDQSIALNASVPTAPDPMLPPDLKGVPDPNICPVVSYPASTGTASTPAGFASTDNRLYVADRTLPVVHVLDTSAPCATKELDPLLSYSYLTPERVVTTSRVAVSPLTPSHKQFVYAVDDTDPQSASVMIFDVSPSSRVRTPVIFEGAARDPYLPPDRLRFSAPVRDVTFVERDFPAPSTTGVGQFGLTCDPLPSTDPASPAAQYRPTTDYTSGARPLNLRGVFGFAMLTNGQVVVIDVEDFDAPCRRPVITNSSANEDFRGCKGDPALYFTTSGNLTDVPTVTNESSCNIVETNRPRSASLSVSNSTVGLRAPSLRSFPQFSNPDPASAITVDQQPRLMAVDFPNPDSTVGTPLPAQVNISAQLYADCQGQTSPVCSGSWQPLELDPRQTSQNSLVLPLNEPRSYAQDESPSLTFEGRVIGDRTSGFLDLTENGATGQPIAALTDPDANFCSAGVEDSDAISAEAASLQIPAANRAAWSVAHADYVQITGDFPVVDDAYWRLGQGQFCADLLKHGTATDALGGDRDACNAEFGDITNLTLLKETRELSILEARSSKLSVTPRHCTSDADCALKLQQLACCFPAGTAYTVRASHQWLLSSAAGLHDIGPDVSGRCVHTASCDPRKKYFRSRAFEVCDPTLPYDPMTDSGGPCSVDNPNVGCVAGTVPGTGQGSATTVADFPIRPGGTASECIFENLTSRFVVYRGRQSSTRDMSFSWQTTGGFAPLSMSIATQSNAVNPQSLGYLPELGQLAVVDGATLGLSLFDLNSLGIVAPSPFF